MTVLREGLAVTGAFDFEGLLLFQQRGLSVLGERPGLAPVLISSAGLSRDPEILDVGER